MNTPRFLASVARGPARGPVIAAGLSCLGFCLSSPSASAVVLTFAQNLAGFNAASGSVPVAINFDGIVSGTDIGGQTIAGVTFVQTGSPLIVVSNTQTLGGYSGAPNPASNILPPTTGANVLSPGGSTLGPGPDVNIEKDWLTLEFQTPVSAFGFDHLSQSADGAGYTSIAVYDAANVALYSGPIPISNLGGGGAPGGADFWGIVSDSANIKRIVITEADDNNVYPDNNIGFDTFRFAAASPNGVPDEWHYGWVIWIALLGWAEIRRRRASR